MNYAPIFIFECRQEDLWTSILSRSQVSTWIEDAFEGLDFFLGRQLMIIEAK